jgi:hypothetical protein
MSSINPMSWLTWTPLLFDYFIDVMGPTFLYFCMIHILVKTEIVIHCIVATINLFFSLDVVISRIFYYRYNHCFFSGILFVFSVF